MKNFSLIVLSLCVLSLAQAEPLQSTFKCKAPGKGKETVDVITLRANKDTLVMNFPNYGVDEKYTASFARAKPATNIPEVLQDRSGGEYFEVANAESFVHKDNKYTPMYAFASNGILRDNASGELIVLYKRRLKSNPNSNEHEWPREYDCEVVTKR